MVLELFACQYMNHKWWKQNPENSPDPDTITALMRPWHMLCSVVSAVAENQAPYAEAVPAVCTDQVTIGQMSSVLYQCQQLQEKGIMWSSALY